MRGAASIGRRAALALPALALLPARAHAQVDERLAITTAVPQGYDRGRNVSVQQTQRPDYEPLGVRFGGFLFFPRLEAGAGGTTNTYLDNHDPTASAFRYILPSAALRTDWSRHFIQLSGNALLRDYVGQSRRNERTWDLAAATRLDVARSFQITSSLDVSRNVENNFSGEVGSTVAALSHYRRNAATTQATYTQGRIRTFLLADYTELRFANVPLAGGGSFDQSDRDRSVARLTAQVEYARSPGISFFGQIGGARTRFDHDLLAGGDNLDSKAVRLLGGVNLDIAGRVRGTIGLGYSIQDYDAAAFRTVRGLSIDTRVEFFLSPRLTLAGTGQRTVENAALRQRLPYWNTQFTLRADYELLRNLILTSSADYSHQSYIDSPLSGDIYKFNGGARYLASRRVNLQGSLSYRLRSSSSADLINRVDEGRLTLGIVYQL